MFKHKKSQSERKAGIILSYLQTGLGMLISLIYTPVMLRLLGQSEYGLYQAAASVISYLSLFSLGFSSSYIRFYSRYKAKEDNLAIAKLNSLFLLVFSVAAVLSLISGGILAFNAEIVFGTKFTSSELDTSKILLLLMAFSMAVTFLDSVFSMYITAQEKFTFQRILSIISMLLKPTITLPLLLMGFKSIAYAGVSTIVTVIVAISDLIYARKYGMRFNFTKPEWNLLREIAVFSFFVFLTSLSSTINATIDKILLSRYEGSEAVAIYEIGEKFNAYLIQLSITISVVFIPKVNMMIAENRSTKELTDLMVRIGRIQFLVLAYVLGGFFIAGRYFIHVYAGAEYDESYMIAMMIMVASFIPYIQNIGIEIQKAYNKHIFRSIVYFIISLLNIFISIPLIRIYGISGAAIGTAISLLLGNSCIMNIYYAKGIHLDMVYFWKSLGRTIGCACLAIVLGTITKLLLPINSVVGFFANIIIFSLLYFVLMWFRGMNENEKYMMKRFIRLKS